MALPKSELEVGLELSDEEGLAPAFETGVHRGGPGEFVATYSRENVTSIAFPQLVAGR